MFSIKEIDNTSESEREANMAEKKIVSAAVAAATAALLVPGGIFALQFISRTALNEASDIVNPAAR